MTKTPIQWRRVSIEAVAIVISILLAFAIDAWWGARNDARRELEILKDLESEFVANAEGLRAMRDYHTRQADSALFLYSVATGRSDADSVAVESLIRMVLVQAGSYNPSDGVFHSVSESGDLALISDDSLRYALAGWSGVLEDALEEQAWMFRDVQTLFVPFLTERVSLSSIYRFEADRHQELLGPPFPLDRAKLLGDAVFQNHLLTKANGEAFAAEELADVELAADQIIRLVRKSLNRGSS